MHDYGQVVASGGARARAHPREGAALLHSFAAGDAFVSVEWRVDGAGPA